jgi:hypothetical protein
MDVDEKGMVYALCQRGWPAFLLMGTMGVSIVSPLSASTDVRQTAKNFPIIKPMDAASNRSRDQYNTKKCSWELAKLKKDLTEEDTQDKVQALVKFVTNFTVRNSDLICRQVSQARMIEKPNSDQLCQESLHIALEQTLPLAKNWECLKSFEEYLCEEHSLFFDILKKEFGKATYLPQDQPDDGSGVVIAFDSEYAQNMERKTRLIVENYEDLFSVEDYSEEIMALLAKYEKEIKDNMANAKISLGPSQASATLNHMEDTLTRFIVKNANEIFEKFPNEKLEKIYNTLVRITLRTVLPAISELGPLWALANVLKNTSTSPLRKNFETAFQLHGTSIANQGIPPKEDEQDTDQANQTETEKRIAARRKQEAERHRLDMAAKHIAVQIDIIIEDLRMTMRSYLSVFQKRNSSNWPI